MPSTIVSLPKKKAQCTTISLEKSSFLEDSSGTSSCSQSELDEKSPSSQRKPSQPRRRRHHQKRNSTQPVVMENSQPDSAVTYAGPDFMNDAPSPSSLPLPSSVMSSSTKQQRQQRQQQQPLTDVSKPYLMDPISEIQEKLRLMLKVQV